MIDVQTTAHGMIRITSAVVLAPTQLIEEFREAGGKPLRVKGT